jgi:hypothetical protein
MLEARNSHYEPSADVSTSMPLPIVTGGLGLVFAYALPGGLSGGQGFLIGLAAGLLLVAFGESYSGKKRRMRRIEPLNVECPHCGKQVEVTILQVKAEPVRPDNHETSHLHG